MDLFFRRKVYVLARKIEIKSKVSFKEKKVEHFFILNMIFIFFSIKVLLIIRKN